MNASATDLVYLKPEVRIEPLVLRWYAWSHLIGPAQLAMHLSYRILPLMRSFASNPSVHISANSDPSMYGGPFMDLHEADVEKVRALIAATELECADLIRFANDLSALDAQLQANASGYTLNEYYAALPASLQGLVELMYDTHHHPSVRTFEALLYDTGMAAGTQEIMFHTASETERAFFMSTPRLDTPDNISLRIDFADKRLDALTAMRTEPASFAGIAALLGVAPEKQQAFRLYFGDATVASRGARDAAHDGIRMRYFGHACVLFQSAGISILFDPFFSIDNPGDERFTLADLPDVIDYVVITHSHQDHFSPEMLIQLRHRIKRIIVPPNNSGNIADPSMKLTLQALGFDRIDQIDCFEKIDLPGGHLMSLPFTGEHADLSIYSKHAILLSLAGRQFMFLVDSDGRDAALYRRMMRKVGPVDALFIGMECHGAPLNWLYEPLLGKPLNRRNNESRRLSGADCTRAEHILAEIKPHRVFVYAMGQEPWMQYIMGLQYQSDSVQLLESDRFIAHCNSLDIQAERLYLQREISFPAAPNHQQ